MSAALITLRDQLISIEQQRAARGGNLDGALIGRRSRAKRLATEAMIAAGQAKCKAWAAVDKMQDDVWRSARQCEMNLGAAC